MDQDLPFNDRADFEDADRGFLGKLEPGVVKTDDGKIVWDIDQYSFFEDECPDTANPSLWRQGQLLSRQGLYEVVQGIYQIRGLDLSNMTLIEGDKGVIVVDPLISAETAAAGLALYRKHRGEKPVTGVIYTHSHIDHFGGVKGVIDESADVPIIAPENFLENAVSENVYAGPAMLRRAVYMYGSNLAPGPEGQLSAGLGMNTSAGKAAVIPPTIDITKTGQTETVDGVRIEFQLTPGTEAPAEMNFFFPDFGALCMAENATHNLHNLLTLRGAVVRDPRVWSRYLNEALRMFGDKTEAVFASHHWPTWGKDQVRTFLSQQRDLYGYLHDQTLRLLNQGFVGAEIAEQIDKQMPPALQKAWHTHGYYGSVSHNVKAIYQRYMGWFDGNPAHLWQLPAEEAAKRYVDTMGGQDEVIDKARKYAEEGDLRFAAELLNHAIFADESNADAKNLLADVYQKLGYGAENGTWRNFFLVGAKELREGLGQAEQGVDASGMAGALTVEMIFDSLAVRVNGPKAWGERFSINWTFTDLGQKYRMEMSNGVLIHNPTEKIGEADLSIELTKPELLELISGKDPAPKIEGDASLLDKLTGLLDQPNPKFAIITP